MYQPRSYRHWVQGRGLVSFNVVVKETDLFIRAISDLSDKARISVLKYRNILEQYIKRHPSFATSLEPLEAAKNASDIIIDMASAAARAGVGPMASVAGAIAQFVAQELLAYSPEIIIENGGDIYLKSLKNRNIAIYAGKSPLSGKMGLQIRAAETPLSMCTSSGTVGHSLSFGKADAVVAVSKSATLADAAATAIGNIILQPDDIPAGIELAKGIDGLLGVVIIIGDKMGAWGELTLCRLDEPPQP
jgi:ApbE superfamily uncharacterized protein (UPF0280 family)